MKLSISLLALFSSVSAIRGPVQKPVSYDGVKVLRLAATTDTQVKFLDSLIDQLDLDTWKNSHRVNANVDVEVPANKLEVFQDAVSRAGITNVLVMHEDLGVSIQQETADSKRLAAAAVVADQSWFNAYHPYADHLAFLNALATQYPNNAKVVLSGNSTQGQAITGIHIYGSGGAGSKPAVIFHGTVHAREWISGMVNDYLAYSLLSNYANSTEVKGYVDKYDFYIFPHVNPDGFVYTQTTERLWRKNRAPNSGNSCVGQDINRNWPSHWDVPGGASTNPCADDYKGPSAGSTVENKALTSFINGLAQSAAGAKLYVDWHSYSQLFMSPYGYSCSTLPADNTELVALAAGFGSALKAVHGTKFTTGPICTTIYQATGSSADYTYDVSKIKYSFAAELRDTGANGFVLPVNQIRPSGEEVWAGVKYLLTNIK